MREDGEAKLGTDGDIAGVDAGVALKVTEGGKGPSACMILPGKTFVLRGGERADGPDAGGAFDESIDCGE